MSVMHLAKFLRSKMDIPNNYRVIGHTAAPHSNVCSIDSADDFKAEVQKYKRFVVPR